MVEATRLGEAPHFHRRFAVELHHVEVKLRREAAVEAQFRGAAGAAFVHSAVIEEGQDDRLLDLPRELACQQHPRGVGFDQFDAGRAERRARGIEQCPDQWGQGLGHNVDYEASLSE